MEEPLQITFHNLKSSETAEAAIRERFAKLDRLYDRLTACRVAVECVAKQHQTGNVYDVRIDMLVPGQELVVSKAPHKAKERYVNPDVYVAIREAFDAAERQLLAFKDQLRGGVKDHGPPLVHGQVAELHPEEDYGYLLGNTGALIYFHRNALMEGEFEALKRGDKVHYVEAKGSADPSATKVWPGADHRLD